MQIETKQYAQTESLNTFNNRVAYDNVGEYSFTTTRKLNDDSVIELLKQNGINLFGFIRINVQEIGYNIDQMAKVFKYTAREIMC